MDKKTRQIVDTLAYSLGYLAATVLDFILAIHIAKSDMKAFWKVIGIDIAIVACYRASRRARKIIDQVTSEDDSVE